MICCRVYASPCLPRWLCPPVACTLWSPCSWVVSLGVSSCWVQFCPSCFCLLRGTAGSQIALLLLGSPSLWWVRHLRSDLVHWRQLRINLLFLSIFSSSPLPASPPLFPVFAGTGIWGQSGDHRRWLRPRWEKCDHHEPSHPSGLDVPVVLSAQVQLPSPGEDLPQGCAEGCPRLWWVSWFIFYSLFLSNTKITALASCASSRLGNAGGLLRLHSAPLGGGQEAHGEHAGLLLRHQRAAAAAALPWRHRSHRWEGNNATSTFSPHRFQLLFSELDIQQHLSCTFALMPLCKYHFQMLKQCQILPGTPRQSFLKMLWSFNPCSSSTTDA